jgi:hypothetical protein
MFRKRKTAFFIGMTLLASILLLHSDHPAQASVPSGVSTLSSGLPSVGPNLVSDPADTRVPGQSITANHPQVAFTNCVMDPLFFRYLAVWYNDRPGNDDIYGQLINTDGTIYGSRRAIAAGPGADRRYPDVAHSCNYNEFLVVWEREDSNTGAYTIQGRRVEAMSGEPLEQQPGIPYIEIAGGGPIAHFRPKVAHAFTAGIYLVVWQSHTQGNISSDIKGQLVGNDGSLIGTNFLIAQGDWTFSYSNPDIAYNRRSNEFLVVFQRQDKNAPREDIAARIVRPDKTMPPNQIVVANYPPSDSTAPAVAAIPTASVNGQYFVVYELEYAPNDRGIAGRIVNGNGTVGNDLVISQSNYDQFEPAVAGSETRNEYLVTWSESYSLPPFMFTYHAAGRTVRNAGTATGKVGDFGGAYAGNGAVASGYLADFLFVYEDQLLDINGSSMEIFSQIWGNRIYLPLVRR